MARLLLAVLLPLAALGCGENLSCKKCQVPVYDGFSHDADAEVKNVVFANEGRAGFSTPVFSTSADSQGCMLLHAQCFKEVGDEGTNNLPTPPGNIIDVVIPPIVPIEQPNPTFAPLRIRRQAPEDHLYNYFIWTEGRNHSLQSYWTHQRNDINLATFRCNDKAQWTYEYSNKTVAHVTGLYCFWVARSLTEQAIGYDVPQPLPSPMLMV